MEAAGSSMHTTACMPRSKLLVSPDHCSSILTSICLSHRQLAGAGWLLSLSAFTFLLHYVLLLADDHPPFGSCSCVLLCCHLGACSASVAMAAVPPSALETVGAAGAC
jgi:hypothetical protein